MTDKELEMVRGEIRNAMRRTAEMIRDQCAQYVRLFGTRVGNEYLAKMIDRIPLSGDFGDSKGTDNV